jgi:hypothetical protein
VRFFSSPNSFSFSFEFINFCHQKIDHVCIVFSNLFALHISIYQFAFPTIYKKTRLKIGKYSTLCVYLGFVLFLPVFLISIRFSSRFRFLRQTLVLNGRKKKLLSKHLTSQISYCGVWNSSGRIKHQSLREELDFQPDNNDLFWLVPLVLETWSSRSSD